MSAAAVKGVQPEQKHQCRCGAFEIYAGAWRPCAGCAQKDAEVQARVDNRMWSWCEKCGQFFTGPWHSESEKGHETELREASEAEHEKLTRLRSWQTFLDSMPETKGNVLPNRDLTRPYGGRG